MAVLRNEGGAAGWSDRDKAEWMLTGLLASLRKQISGKWCRTTAVEHRMISSLLFRASQEMGCGVHSWRTKFCSVLLGISEGKPSFQGACEMIDVNLKVPARALHVHYAHFQLS